VTIPTPDALCEELRAICQRRIDGQAPPIAAFKMPPEMTLWDLNERINEAADLIQQQLATIERLSAALEDCRDVLRDVPAPHWVAFWRSRILAAIRNADAALGKDASDE
jgi:hypothetical protein